MIAGVQRYSISIAALMYIVLLLPPVQHVLTASMAAQMLVQIPLLIAVGWLLRDALPPRLAAATDAWNHNGITGLVLATLATAYWMLPRSLDAAATEALVTAAKFISVPLLIGLPMGLSWRRMGFVVRGLFILELVAMFFRLGWLYLISPVRLCNNYLIGDQQRSGKYMLVIGAAILVWVGVKLLWGHFDALPDDRLVTPSHRIGPHQFPDHSDH
ncbi:MAG: hypothetical protein WCC11_11850 [Gammaproteobacteria bacterium]